MADPQSNCKENIKPMPEKCLASLIPYFVASWAFGKTTLIKMMHVIMKTFYKIKLNQKS